MCVHRDSVSFSNCGFCHCLFPVLPRARISRSFFEIPLWMLLKSILDWYCSHQRSHCSNTKGQAGWKEKELWLLRKLNTAFPVITISRQKFHAHCKIFLTAVCTSQKVLKEYKTRVLLGSRRLAQDSDVALHLLTFLEWPFLALVT